MEIAIAATLYLSFGAWLILQTLGAPAVFPRLAIRLCATEFFAATVYAGTESDLFGDIAAIHIPILGGVMMLFAAAYGVFVVRGW